MSYAIKFRIIKKFLLLFLFFNQTPYVSGWAQNITISGFVQDSLTQNPLPFATIGIKGTTFGTASNKNGEFALNILPELEDSILFISYMGFHSFQERAGSLGQNEVIKLAPSEILLDEIEIVPWSAWEFVQNAVKKIPENYLSNPFLTRSYYNEYIIENEVFLKFTEGVIETYNPAYGDTSKIASRLVQARRRDDLGKIEFMRNRLERRLKKEEKKAKRRGEEWEPMTLDEAVLSATFGGPRMILRNDPVRDTASYLNPELSRFYNYEIAGYTTYDDEKVIIIHFESRRKYEHRKRAGEIFISLDSDAIVAIDFESRIIIPDGVRPLLFLAGFGMTDPVLHATMHYRPFKDRWYINDISIEAFSDLTDKNMFSKNNTSTFNIYQSLITMSIDLDNVSKIPKEDQLNNWKPLEEQIEEDPEFWKQFDLIGPSTEKNPD